MHYSPARNIPVTTWHTQCKIHTPSLGWEGPCLPQGPQAVWLVSLLPKFQAEASFWLPGPAKLSLTLDPGGSCPLCLECSSSRSQTQALVLMLAFRADYLDLLFKCTFPGTLQHGSFRSLHLRLSNFPFPSSSLRFNIRSPFHQTPRDEEPSLFSAMLSAQPLAHDW